MIDRAPLVGLSISDTADLRRWGLGKEHLDDAFAEVAKHLLAARCRLAYGGDLRVAGYTELLVELVRRYPSPDRHEGVVELVNYLAWPMSAEAGDDQLADMIDAAAVVRLGAPQELGPAPDALLDGGGEERRARALSVRAMRRRLADEVAAQVIVGGKVSGFAGPFHGILEEAANTVIRGKALYVVGGFHGCAEQVATLVATAAAGGDPPPEFTAAYQREHTPWYADLERACTDHGAPIDWAEVLDPFAGGLARNGLTEEENARLAVTDDVDEIVALVLRGLHVVMA